MNPAPNLVLVGPMGAGKTSIGKRLAPALGLAFVDADSQLELAAGASVATLFEVEGEAGFRAREEQLLLALLGGRDQLVSTGGGAVLSAAVRETLARQAFVVYLKLDVDQQLLRLARDRVRPLLAGGNRRATLGALAAVRNPLYESVAQLVFEPAAMNARTAASRLAAALRAQWRPGQAA